MLKALVAQLFHEGNSFNRIETVLEDFDVVEGADIVSACSGTGSVLGGALDELARLNVTVVPAVAATARPGGPVAQAVFERFAARIVEQAASVQPDLVVMDLHGAMTTADMHDPEGELLERLRRAVGEDTVIGIGLDLHAHVTDRMLVNADIVTACKHNPHSDYAEAGATAARLAVGKATGTIRPVTAVARVPMLTAGNNETTDGPLKDMHAMAKAWMRAHPAVLDISICNVMPLIDVPDMAQVVIAIADGDDTAAARICVRLAEELWRRRGEFKDELPDAATAIDQIFARDAERPFVIGDYGDRVLAGAPGDGTDILAAALARGPGLKAAIPLTDPAAVDAAKAAGVGRRVDVKVGGAFSTGVPQIEVSGTVLRLSDGVYTMKGPLLAGQVTSLGETAVVDVDGVKLILTSRAGLSQDVNCFESLGIRIAEQDFVVAKSGNHFQMSFEGIATPIKVATHGIGTYRPGQFEVHRRPVYPEIDEDIGEITATLVPGRPAP